MAEALQSMPRPLVSACIITFNEADRLADCIRSVQWCDEILVVDSHSTDRTRELAAELGAWVIERDWPGHVAQKEFAIRAAKHDWVLCVDADERISPELRREVMALRDAGFPGAVGWKMPRMSCYLGKWIRHGTWYPDLSLRLFDRRHGRWGGMDPHDRVELAGAPGRLRHHLVHHPYRSFAEHLQTIDRYTTIMAHQMHQRGRRARLADVALRPPFAFLRFYWFKLGVIDGWRGLLLAYLHAHYTRMKYAKLLVLARTVDKPPRP